VRFEIASRLARATGAMTPTAFHPPRIDLDDLGVRGTFCRVLLVSRTILH
jgi:hypothetical protein